MDAKLVKVNAEKIWKGVLDGFNQNPKQLAFGSSEHRLLLHMRHNVHVTAAFKNHHNTLEVARLMFDDAGKLRPFNAFKNAALPIMEKYNRSYLEAEYYTALGASRMASKWAGFQAKGGYLKYITQKDDRVRQEHRALEGTVLPVNDPFWDTYYPPNGWRCRCLVTWVGTDAEMVPPTSLPQLKTEFSNNVGKTGNVFTSNLPYFTVEGKFLEKAENLFGYKPPVDPERFANNILLFDKFNNDPNFKLDFVDNMAGGFVFRNVKALKAEIDASRTLAKQGNGVAMLAPVRGVKSPDIELNGSLAEIKTNKTATKNSIDSLLRKGAGQASTVVLHIKSSLSANDLKEAIINRLKRTSVKKVIIIRKDGSVFEFDREKMLSKDFKIK